MSTSAAPAVFICTSSTNGQPVWWVECSCGWSQTQRAEHEDTPRMLDQWRQHHHHGHPGVTIVEPSPATLTPYQVCPYCDATDSTCPGAKGERACCDCVHPGIEH
ncbi:MAG: hypothetical protein ACTH0V_15635 [Microbacteriaceae bacterium]